MVAGVLACVVGLRSVQEGAGAAVWHCLVSSSHYAALGEAQAVTTMLRCFAAAAHT
jgi:hypothetical protein